jgi:hypothetical protein
MSPVGRLVFNTSEVPIVCLVGSTPTSSAITPFRAQMVSKQLFALNLKA